MKKIDLTPEYRALQLEFQALREIYLTLILKLKDLAETEKPNLEAIYTVKIGFKELELLYKQAETAALKYKMELMIACINRKERINLEEIDKIIQHMLVTYYSEINQKADKILEAQQHLKCIMSTEDSDELKKLYYQAAKILHPDVNPNLSEDQIQLWNIITDAYNNGDLLTLRHLTEAILINKYVSDIYVDYYSLQQQTEFFKERNKGLLNKIETIKSEFPFTYADKLHDDKWLSAEYQNIEDQITELDEIGKKYLEYINLMIEN